MGDKVAPYGLSELVTGGNSTYDVRMPDGTIVRGVPQGTTKAQLADRIGKAKNAPDRTGVMGHIDTGLRGATDIMSFGLADKLAAGVNAVLPLDKLTNPNIKSVWETGSLGDAYRSNLHEEQRIAADDQQNRPKSRIAGQIVGGVMGPVPGRGLLAAGVKGAAKSVVKRGIIGSGKARIVAGAANMAGQGAIQAGLHGIGEGDSLSLSDRLDNGVTQAGEGALGSLIGAGVVHGASRLVSPVVKPAVAKLAAMGVIMTPGQRAGAGTLTNWLENVGGSIPGLRVPMQAAKARGLGQYMKGTINEGLKPIGKVLPKKVQAGRAAVDAAQDLVSNHYDDALARVRAPVDYIFQAELGNTASRAANLPPEQAQAFNYVMQHKIAPLVAGATHLDGPALQDVHRSLQKMAASYDRTGDPAKEFLADELRAVRQSFLDLAMRHSPEGTEKFLQANNAEANLSRVYDAASKAHGEGIPTPQQLSAATAKKGYGTTSKSAAAGRARMQDITDAGKAVLPDTLPNSGSADRVLAGSLLTGIGGGSVAVNPAIAGLALPVAPYLPGVDALLQKFALRGQGLKAKAVAEKIRKGALFGGRAGTASIPASLRALGITD